VSQTKAELIKGLNINASAPATALQIDASGNVNIDSNTLYVDATNNRVGLGTTTPGALLDCRGDSRFGALSRFAITESGGDPTIGGTSGSNFLGFTVNGTTRATLTSTGLGIGSTAPQALLSLGDSIPANGQKLLTYDQGNARSGLGIVTNVHRMFTSSGAVLSFGHVSDSDGSTYSERARIDTSGRLLVNTSTSLETDALLQTYKSSGNLTSRTECGSLSNGNYVRTLIISGGRESGLGVYKHPAITNACSYLQLTEEDATATFFWSDNSDNFRISTNGDHIGTTSGTVVGTQTSDERIKNILGPVKYGLNTLKQIEPVLFSLKSEPETKKLGFIAQQMMPLVPESVFDTNEHIEGEPEDAPTKLGMEYVSLIPVLVNAIKELSAEVDALKAQLQTS